MKKTILFMLLVFLAFCLLQANKESAPIEKTTKSEIKSLLTELPGMNFKGEQLDSNQLRHEIGTQPIDVVVRLNGEADILSVSDEARICKDSSVQFYYFNIEGNPQAAYDQIKNFLRDSNTLVHCLHGFDRAGVISGLWLKENDYTDQQIIEFNGWENYVEKKGLKYQKYYDAVFKN